MTIAIVIYFLIAVYVAQHTTIIGWHYTKWDAVLEYFFAVFWFPASLVLLIFIILDKLSYKKV